MIQTYEFKVIGYSLDYYIGNKYIGSQTISEPDREEVGYYSKIEATATEDIVFRSKKRIKKGQEYATYLYPMNARIKTN